MAPTSTHSHARRDVLIKKKKKKRSKPRFSRCGRWCRRHDVVMGKKIAAQSTSFLSNLAFYRPNRSEDADLKE